MTSCLCVACEALCDLIQPQIMSRLIDQGVAQLDMDYVVRMGLLMLGVTLLGAVFACARNILSSRASQRFGADLRRDLFVKVQNMRVSDTETYDAGSLITRMTNDVTQMTNFVNGIMRIFFKAPVVCLGSIALAAMMSLRATVIVLCIVGVAFAAIGLSMKLSYPEFAKVQKAVDKLNTTVREYLMGIRLVKAFGRQEDEAARFAQASDELALTSRKAARILAVFSPVTNLAANCGIALILLLGARWVGHGQMHVGQVVAFVSYMTQIMVALSMISNILNVFVRTKASYHRIAQVMDEGDLEPVGLSNDTPPPAPMPQAPLMAMEDVSFAYPLATGDMALSHIHCDLEPGRTLGVIGPTGSGKSTLAALMLRFYDATQGVIRFGGRPVGQLPVHLLRRQVAIVPQSPMLFNGSIRDNLRWGDPCATEDQLIAALNLAQAGFALEGPQGLDTQLGQAGVNLSGGQKQRLSIARALIRNPQLLILDDATSALDALTEKAVQDGLRQLPLSLVLISQRISSVMRADRILVLDHGKVAGFGDHQQLMASCPVYRDIAHSQMGKEDAHGRA